MLHLSRRSVRNAAALIGLLALNALITLYRWYPLGTPILLLLPAPELVVATLFLVWLRRSKTPEAYRRGRLGVGLLLAPLIAFGIGETFYRYVYHAGFDPRTDLAFLPSFFNMIAGRELFQGPVVITVTFLVGGALGGWLLGRILGAASRRIATFSMRLPLAIGAAIVAAVGAYWEPPLTVLLAGRLTEKPAAFAAEELPPALQRVSTSVPGDGRRDSGALRSLFPALANRDVRVFVVESYGHTLFSNEEHRVLIEPVYDRLEGRLSEAGFSVVSHFLTSPAFGGRSWLADATLLSGLWIADQQMYNTMHTSGAVTLVNLMRQAGYYTLLAAPGMTYIDEEFFDFFPYETRLIQHDFDYQGRSFSFGGGMTDQYLINNVRLRLETSDDPRPVFTTYLLVSSHVPFNVLPPFIPDWESIGDGSVYWDHPRRVFENNWLSGGEYPEGYTASIEYVLETIVDYLAIFIDDDTVAVIVGDHQPRIPIAEPESTYSVPIHLVTRDATLLESFRAHGFADGLAGDQPLPHPGMDEFYRMFVDAALGRRVSRGGTRRSPSDS